MELLVRDIKGIHGSALQKEQESIREFVLAHCMRHICMECVDDDSQDTSPLAKKGVRIAYLILIAQV